MISDRDGRTAREVKGREMFGIGELNYSDVGMGNVLSVRVEVAWFVLGVGVVFQVVAGYVFEIGVDFFFFFAKFSPLLVCVLTVPPPF